METKRRMRKRKSKFQRRYNVTNVDLQLDENIENVETIFFSSLKNQYAQNSETNLKEM